MIRKYHNHNSGLLKIWDRKRTHTLSKVNASPYHDWLSINSLPIDSKRLVYCFYDFTAAVDNNVKGAAQNEHWIKKKLTANRTENA